MAVAAVAGLGLLVAALPAGTAVADPVPDEARWVGTVTVVATEDATGGTYRMTMTKTDPTVSYAPATGSFDRTIPGACSDGVFEHPIVSRAYGSGPWYSDLGGGGLPIFRDLAGPGSGLTVEGRILVHHTIEQWPPECPYRPPDYDSEDLGIWGIPVDWSALTIEWDQTAHQFYEHLKGAATVKDVTFTNAFTWDIKRVHLDGAFLLALDDEAWTHPGVPVPVPVLANDLVPTGEIATVESATQPQHGTVDAGISGVTYTPAVGYTGADSFTYTITSSGGGTSTATVAVNVGNRPPVAVDDAAQTDDAGVARVSVLGNDSDPDGDPVSLAAFGQGTYGTVTRDGDVLVYTRSPGASPPDGLDGFPYTVWDTFGAASTATVTIGSPALVPCPPLTLTGTASSTFGSRAVTWHLSGVVGAGAVRGTLTSPGLAPVPVAATDTVTTTYPTFGEKAATLELTRPCQGTVTGLGVADPVSTYAPSVAFAKGERYFPDAVGPFLDNALLVADRPLGSKVLLSDPRCPDLVVARGGAVSAARLRSMLDARPGPEVVPKTVPRLSVARLGGRGVKAYPLTEFQAYPVKRPNRCRAAGVSSATSTGAVKKQPNDTGLVLSTTGAPPGLRSGSSAAGAPRAPFYVHYVPGRYIAYWFFYPANVWRENRITELHEGDWERALVNIDPSGLLAGTPNISGGRTPSAHVAAFFQHYCKADQRRLDELTFDRGTSANPVPPDTHVVVYSAKGGHASYHTHQARVRIACWEYPGAGFGEEPSGTTPTWRPWTRRGGLVDATTQPWWGFRGSWGDPGPSRTTFLTYLAYGPQAPGGQSDGAPKDW